MRMVVLLFTLGISEPTAKICRKNKAMPAHVVKMVVLCQNRTSSLKRNMKKEDDKNLQKNTIGPQQWIKGEGCEMKH